MKKDPKILLAQVRAWVGSHLSKERLAHVRSVARVAVRLSRRYGETPWRAELAAWLHDAAKEMEVREMRELLKGTPYRWDRWERRIPELMHGQAAAALAWKVFGIRDREVLAAVRHHTMGRPRMERLETILFVADYIEPGRDFEGVHHARRAVTRSLTAGALAKAEHSHAYLVRKGHAVHPRLKKTRDWLVRHSSKRVKGAP